MEKVEGAAAGYYLAALFESARPGHRGLNTARLARDARLGRPALRVACRTRRAPAVRHSRVAPVRILRRVRRSRLGAVKVRGKPRIGDAA